MKNEHISFFLITFFIALFCPLGFYCFCVKSAKNANSIFNSFAFAISTMPYTESDAHHAIFTIAVNKLQKFSTKNFLDYSKKISLENPVFSRLLNGDEGN